MPSLAGLHSALLPLSQSEESFPLSAESGPQREVPELEASCCQKQRGAVSWGPSRLRKQRWAVEGGAGEVVIGQTGPSESPVSGTGQPGRPCGEGAFWACQWVPGGWVKTRCNLASEEVPGRALSSLNQFCDAG